MKKAYETPAAEVFGLQTEGSILSGSLSVDSSTPQLKENGWLSNKKSIWDSGNWTQSGN